MYILKISNIYKEVMEKTSKKQKREILKQADYFLRAVRIEEAPILQKIQDNINEKEYGMFIENGKIEHIKLMKERDRLSRMINYRDIFINKIINKRNDECKEKNILLAMFHN